MTVGFSRWRPSCRNRSSGSKPTLRRYSISAIVGSVIVSSLRWIAKFPLGSTRWPFLQAVFTPLHETLSVFLLGVGTVGFGKGTSETATVVYLTDLVQASRIGRS